MIAINRSVGHWSGHNIDNRGMHMYYGILSVSIGVWRTSKNFPGTRSKNDFETR